ncbi:MAG: hypothetical protein M3Q17_02545 [Actinomycetota bacterium]|nr:hypothetical protein [Actinomycetota bacterium]
MRRPEVAEPQVSQVRGEVGVDVLAVAALGCEPEPVGDLDVDPLAQIALHGAPAVVAVAAVFELGHDLGESSGRLRLCAEPGPFKLPALPGGWVVAGVDDEHPGAVPFRARLEPAAGVLL